MDIILRNVEQSQLPLIKELAKALGLGMQERVSDYAEDKEHTQSFVAEMDDRTANYEAGTAGLLSLDELEEGARVAYKKQKQG